MEFNYMKTILFTALTLCLQPLVIHAQDYSIDWYKIAGGGGTSANGAYSLTGTIGQPDAGHMSGGNYSLDGGFWGIAAAIQTPGAPPLTITRTGSSVFVSWPSPSTGFALQQNSNLAITNWTNFTGTVNDDGTNKSITVPTGPGNMFFRLKK